MRAEATTIAPSVRSVSAGGVWRGAVLVAALAMLAAAPDPAAEELAARRVRIAKMDANQQQELLRKFERFQALPAEEQNRLRKLQAEITADPNSERLLDLLGRYHEWLKTITPSQRARLAELPAKERVHEIERITRAASATPSDWSRSPGKTCTKSGNGWRS